MYEEFYGLSEKPFSIQPDPSFLYWGRAHRLAYAMLEYGVLNHAGISIVTGEVGCGKTTLVHRLLDQLSDSHTVALLSNIQRDRGDLLSWVLMGFGQPFREMDHVEKFAELQRFFISEYSKGRRVVLIIDEAQNLSIDMLEEIRMLSNINAGKHQLLQLILIGQPQLKEILNRPDMLQLVQRVGSDFHLTPLSRDEVHAYIETRLSIAGATRPIFSTKAVDLIAAESRGVPRVINIIADTSLVYGFSAEASVVDEESVGAVIKDKGSYGVFGIASDDDLQEPVETAGGPDSFLKAGANENGAAAEQENGVITEHGGTGVAFADGTTLYPDLKPAADKTSSSVGTNGYEQTVQLSAQSVGTPVRGNASASETIAPQIQNSNEKTSNVALEADKDPLDAEVGVILCGGNQENESVLKSLSEYVDLVVYVYKRGEKTLSFDESDNIETVELSPDQYTLGKARNAGYRRLKKNLPDVAYVQFIEEGFLLEPDWIENAVRFMHRRPEVAVLGGQITPPKERKPFFSKMAAIARQAPEGEAMATGDAFFIRADAFETAGGFRADLPWAETADLCIRLRRRGAHVWRLSEAMANETDGLKSIGAWFGSRYRAGRAFATGAAAHGAPPEKFAALERRRAIVWGGLLPALFVFLVVAAFAMSVASVATAWSIIAVGVMVLGAAIFLMKAIATTLSAGPGKFSNWIFGVFSTIGHVPELFGVFAGWRTLARARKNGKQR